MSPTDDMHIGDLRIAILHYLSAAVRNEAFLIRIDDTDKDSFVEGKDTEILQIMQKFALKHDTVYHQSEHIAMHQRLAIRLLEEGKAFICTCTDTDHCHDRCIERSREEITQLKAAQRPFVTRIKAPSEHLAVTDLLVGEITTPEEPIEHFTILKQDGTPTARFAAACDDMFDNITLVIRDRAAVSESLRESSLKQALGYTEKTEYLHLPPLSSAGDESIAEITVKSLFEEGFIPDAIINYLLLLDYPHAPGEIFTLPEAIAWFQPEKLAKKGAPFDKTILRKINQAHLKEMDEKRLSTLFGFADADIGRLAKLYLDEVSTINELEQKVKPIFAPKSFDNQWGTEMQLLQKILNEAPMIHSYDAFISYLLQESGLEASQLERALRLLLTGTLEGPPLSEIYPCINPYLLEVIS